MAELEPECDEDLPPFEPLPSPTPSQEEADLEQECDPLHRAERDLADGQSERVAGDLLRFAKEQRRNIKDLKEQLPEDFTCSITQNIMIDPVVCADGHTYERAGITQWLKQNDTSPNTGLTLPHKNLAPNIALRRAIQHDFPNLYEAHVALKNEQTEPEPEDEQQESSEDEEEEQDDEYMEAAMEWPWPEENSPWQIHVEELTEDLLLFPTDSLTAYEKFFTNTAGLQPPDDIEGHQYLEWRRRQYLQLQQEEQQRPWMRRLARQLARQQGIWHEGRDSEGVTDDGRVWRCECEQLVDWGENCHICQPAEAEAEAEAEQPPTAAAVAAAAEAEAEAQISAENEELRAELLKFKELTALHCDPPEGSDDIEDCNAEQLREYIEELHGELSGAQWNFVSKARDYDTLKEENEKLKAEQQPPE